MSRNNLTSWGLVILLTINTGSLCAFTEITQNEVHARLVKGDTLLLLDVRESSEYKAGHIAEPEGQLPLTPALIPWSSGVLEKNYQALPPDIDIIIYCKIGGRSKAAAKFLESKGFTRLYNMTGGFISWNYEKRENGFGDHSGKWVRVKDKKAVTIACAGAMNSASLLVNHKAFAGMDSVYIELHLAAATGLPQLDAPQSDVAGLYRISVLNRFGLSLFSGDSLSLAKPAQLSLYFMPNEFSSLPRNDRMTAFVPGKGWIPVTHTLKGIGYHRTENVLRQWYNLEGFYGSTSNQ